MEWAIVGMTEALEVHGRAIQVVLRASPARGIGKGDDGKGWVDPEAHVIHNVAIVQRGVVKDERLEIDDVFLDEVVAAGNKAPRGVRVRFDHPSASARSMGTYMGRAKGFRRDDGTVIASELRLSEVGAVSPDGDLRTYMERMAETEPDSFGMSIVFTPRAWVRRRDENDEIVRDEEGQPLPSIPRLKRLWAVDFVDEGDATDGLFGVTAGTPADVMSRYLDRYFQSRGILGAADHEETEPMADDVKKEKADAESGTEMASATEGLYVTDSNSVAVVPAAAMETGPAKTQTTELSAADRDKIARAERQRIADIEATAKHWDQAALGRTLIDDGVPYAAACRAMLEAHAELPAHQPVAGAIAGEAARMTVGADARDKFRAVAADALALRINLAGELGEDRKKAAREFMGYSLLEMARECLRRANVSTGGKDKMAVARIALGTFGASSSDFPYLLENVVNKAMMKGYEAAPTTWDRWARRGSVSDFKTFSRVRLSEADDLEIVPEGAEFKDSAVDEAREQGQAATYGRLFSITRQAIVNDDLGQLTRQPERFGQSAARLPDKLLYSDLLSHAMGPLMGSGKRLFVDTVGGTIANANWFDDGDVTSLTSVLDLTNGQAAINHALMLLGKRTGLKGLQRLNIRPRFALIPPELEMFARIIFASAANVTDNKNAGVINPWEGLVEPVVIPEFSDTTNFTGASTTAWTLVADANVVDTYEVFFLEGAAQPTLEEEEGFKIEGRAYKVRTDVGVKCLDDVGFVRSKGAA